MHIAGTRYFTTAEVSARYRIPERTLKRWRMTGAGPAYVRMGPRRALYREQDLEDWTTARVFHRVSDEPDAATLDGAT